MPFLENIIVYTKPMSHWTEQIPLIIIQLLHENRNFYMKMEIST